MTDNKAEAERLAKRILIADEIGIGSRLIDGPWSECVSFYSSIIESALDAAEQRGREKALDEVWLKAVSVQRLGYSITQLLPEIRSMKGDKK